jgi:hypothetical protein
MKIYDLNDYPLSDRNGTYGGNSGDKESIIIGNDYWIVKYPKSAKRLRDVKNMSYSTTPESEYIGSHVYEILGYDVHKTILGIRNNHVVVACKDFCEGNKKLIEFRQLKNTYNKTLNEKLDESFTSTGSEHFVMLNEIMLHLQYNPSLQNVEGLKERFWDCLIIDGLINNNDRNNGNWGILRDKSGDVLAPVFDNGAAFSPNVPEERIVKRLSDENIFNQYVNDCKTAYSLDGEHNATFKEILSLDIPELKQAVKRTVPLIKANVNEIGNMITEIPERAGDFNIISKERKSEYFKEIDFKFLNLLLPHYEKIIAEEKQISLKNKSCDDDYDRGR